MHDLKENLEVISGIKQRLSQEPAMLINLTISGSHLYGFVSEDSDVDYRGAYLIKTNKLLGLRNPKNVIELKRGNAEVSLFELRKEIGLALAGNCNVLEHINAKQIVSTAEFIQMRQLINNAWGKIGIYNSYKGMAVFNYRKFILAGKNTVKTYLYVFRGLMAGIYALQTGTIQPNIEVLNDYFKLPEVKELIQLKREKIEVEPIPTNLDTGLLEQRINELFGRMDRAFEKSKIPDRPDEGDAGRIDDFLVGVRKNYMD